MGWLVFYMYYGSFFKCIISMLIFRRALQLKIEMTHAGRIVVNPDNKSPYNRLVKATLSV